MKDIDEELVAQIKTVFENFDDEGSENGWANLRLKYPEKPNRKLPIWWISGIAAAILLAFGLFFTLDKSAQKNQGNQQLVKQKPIIKQKTDSNNISEATAQKEEEIRSAKNSLNNEIDQTQTKKAIITDVKKEELITKIDQPIKIETTADLTRIVNVTQNPINQNIIITNKVDTPQKFTNQNQVIANNNVGVVKDPSYTKKTIEDFLNEQSKILAQKPKEKEKNNSAKNSVDIFTGTFLNYQGDNSAKLNAGIGVNANIKVSKGVFLSFGAGVSQNKLSYNNYRENSDLSYSSASSALPNNGYSNTIMVSPVKLSAQMLNLDIPISFKFYPSKKQNFYIKTGINSNTYLEQKYTYAYTVTKYSTLGINQTENEENIEKTKLKGFDFANSAIFALGINQNVGKNTLIFEPYFKPAIGNMGDKNLRINSVGINLRFNFTSSNKK
jgi:hypothetical protein